ncbi:hypothetical protein ES703_59840 [subsurface metagenome]
MKCEFEEKQYEQLLNNELAGKRRILYIPGQVSENIFGIDAAIFSKNRKFWKLWNNRLSYFKIWSLWKSGAYMKPETWDIMEEELNSDTFPKFKFNIFVQYKRPTYLSNPLGREYGYWNHPYFRYDIKAHQQKVLYTLEQNVSSNAIVVYACPAFWRFRELWDFNERHKLIENSNFVKPHKLNDHKRYSFINGGDVGKAFSNHVDIEGIDLIKEIDRMFEVAEQFKNNSDFLYSLYESIIKIVENLEEDYRIGFELILKYIKIPQHKLAMSIINILIFIFVTNTVWSIGYK